MRKIAFTILLFATALFNLHAQNIFIGNFKNFEHSLLDRKNNVIYAYGKNFYKKINLDNFQVDSIPVFTEKHFDISIYNPIMIDSVSYFIHQAGGLVYKNRNDSIVRIDNSFNHKMQMYSNNFSYNSKIHRFGGYGFWSARNFITYYNHSLNEWEVVKPLNSQEIPENSFKGLHILIGDDFYVFNSMHMNPNDKHYEIFNKKLWNYNFTDKKWTHLGNTDFIEKNETYQLPFIVNNKLMINNKFKITVIDILNNTVKEYKKGLKSKYVALGSTSYFHNNRYYFLYAQNNQLFFNQAQESEMIGDLISTKKLYTNNKNLKLSVFFALGLGLLFALFKVLTIIYKRNNKVVLLENGIKYKRKFIELDITNLKILQLLIKEETVNSTFILKLVEKEQFSRAHNERLKLQKVDELNFKLKALFGITEDLIISEKSNFDRRIREYKIKNRQLFFIK